MIVGKQPKKGGVMGPTTGRMTRRRPSASGDSGVSANSGNSANSSSYGDPALRGVGLPIPKRRNPEGGTSSNKDRDKGDQGKGKGSEEPRVKNQTSSVSLRPTRIAMPKDCRVGIYVDGSNLIYMQSNMGWQIDPAKLYKLVDASAGDQGGRIINANWYMSLKSEGDNSQFRAALNRIGFSVRTKQLKIFHNPDAEPGRQMVQKGNCDAELITDMMSGMRQCDCVILISGDGDFSYTLDALRANSVYTIVISGTRSISLELRNAASQYVKFEDLRGILEKDKDRD